MLKFGETKVAKEKIDSENKTKKNWSANVDNILVSKLIETETNSRYLIGYLDKTISFDIAKNEWMCWNTRTVNWCLSI